MGVFLSLVTLVLWLLFIFDWAQGFIHFADAVGLPVSAIALLVSVFYLFAGLELCCQLRALQKLKPTMVSSARTTRLSASRPSELKASMDGTDVVSPAWAIQNPPGKMDPNLLSDETESSQTVPYLRPERRLSSSRGVDFARESDAASLAPDPAGSFARNFLSASQLSQFRSHRSSTFHRTTDLEDVMAVAFACIKPMISGLSRMLAISVVCFCSFLFRSCFILVMMVNHWRDETRSWKLPEWQILLYVGISEILPALLLLFLYMAPGLQAVMAVAWKETSRIVRHSVLEISAVGTDHSPYVDRSCLLTSLWEGTYRCDSVE